MNGAPLAAHLGRPINELVPDLYPQFESFIHRALQGESTLNFEVQRPNFEAGGGDRTLMLSYQPVRDEAGEVMGVSIVVNDISDRKRVEQALRESEEHYQSMVESNPQIPWIMDAKGRAVEVSPRWERLTGMAREQILGHGWMDALHPDDVELVKQVMNNAIASGQATDVQYRVHRPDGEWRWMRSRGYPRFDPSGKIIFWYGGLEDIQEQKMTEEALQKSQTELQAISDAIPIGIIIADAPEGNIATVNLETKRIFRDAILPGQVIADYGKWRALHTDGQPLKAEEYPLAQAILHGKTIGTLEVLCAQEDGTEASVTLSARPINALDGRRIGGVMFVQDHDSETLVKPHIRKPAKEL
jgi:PAS domain S-box-containing protein